MPRPGADGRRARPFVRAGGIRDKNRVVDATGPGRQPVVDPGDVARVAALVLTQDGHVGHGYILNGPEALTAREQVEILSDVRGHTVDLNDVTPSKLRAGQHRDGTPVQLAQANQNLNELFRAAWRNR